MKKTASGPGSKSTTAASSSETDVFSAEELRRMKQINDEFLSAPGLDPRSVAEVISIVGRGREQAALSRDDEAEAAFNAALAGGERGVKALAPEILSRYVRTLIESGCVTLGPDAIEAYGLEPEKIVVRQALASLAGSKPRVLADAMKITVATLYSFSDVSRRSRPGPEQLYRAALFFRLVADHASTVSKNLAEIAEVATPVKRGRPPKKARRDEPGRTAATSPARRSRQ